MAKPKKFPPPVEQPFLQHLVELRDRLLRVVIVVLVVFLSLFAFANDIYAYLAAPLMAHLPEGASMIATEVASPFLTPFKLTLVLSIFIAVPVILYQLWMFIAPGLYQNEKRLIFPLMFSSTLLFFMGMAFAYYVVFPLVFGFLIGIAPEGVAVMTDISRYLDFVLKMFFAFGIAFEVPIATILVVWSGMTTAADLAAKRPYIIVGAFVFGMLLTPPDVISQTLLALPMWFLFEIGLILSRWYAKPEDEGKPSDTPPEDTPPSDKPGGGGAAAAATSTTTATRNAAAPVSTPPTATAATASMPSAVPENANDSGHGEYEPLSAAQMDAELDRVEAEQALQAQQATAKVTEETPPAVKLESEVTASERAGGDFRGRDGIDEDVHAKATAEALEIARRARGEIPAPAPQTELEEEAAPPVYTEEDHQRIAEEAMAFARARAGLGVEKENPEAESVDAETASEADKKDQAAK